MAKQAQDASVSQHVRKMADTENYPTSRSVDSIDAWRDEFFKMWFKGVIE